MIMVRTRTNRKRVKKKKKTHMNNSKYWMYLANEVEEMQVKKNHYGKGMYCSLLQDFSV